MWNHLYRGEKAPEIGCHGREVSCNPDLTPWFANVVRLCCLPAFSALASEPAGFVIEGIKFKTQ